MSRRIAALLLVIFAPIAPAGAQDLPYGPTLTFAVYRNGEAIGRHVLAFQHDGANLTVSTSIDFAVKLVGFTAYRYTHRAQEVWNGAAFQSIAATTDDNGQRYAIRAQRTAGGLDVQRNAEHEVMP